MTARENITEQLKGYEYEVVFVKRIAEDKVWFDLHKKISANTIDHIKCTVYMCDGAITLCHDICEVRMCKGEEILQDLVTNEPIDIDILELIIEYVRESLNEFRLLGINK